MQLGNHMLRYDVNYQILFWFQAQNNRRLGATNAYKITKSALIYFYLEQKVDRVEPSRDGRKHFSLNRLSTIN